MCNNTKVRSGCGVKGEMSILKCYGKEQIERVGRIIDGAHFLWRQKKVRFSTQMDQLHLGAVPIPLRLGRKVKGWVWSMWLYRMGAGWWGSFFPVFGFLVKKVYAENKRIGRVKGLQGMVKIWNNHCRKGEESEPGCTV